MSGPGARSVIGVAVAVALLLSCPDPVAAGSETAAESLSESFSELVQESRPALSWSPFDHGPESFALDVGPLTSAVTPFAPWDVPSPRESHDIQCFGDSVEVGWVVHYGAGLYPSTDVLTDMTLDGSGNVYVTGTSDGDFLTVKYDQSGDEIWNARYDDPTQWVDTAAALDVDAQGNVYVVGTAAMPWPPWESFCLVKYDPSGFQQWVAWFAGFSGSATALVVDDDGNAYVCGRSRPEPGYDYDFATVKYNSEGVEQWSARFSGPGNLWDEPTAIALDGRGGVVVSGFTRFGSSGGYAFATVNYDSGGVERWHAFYEDDAYDAGKPTALAVDHRGATCVVGSAGSYTPAGYISHQFLTLMYDSAGVQQWVAGDTGGFGEAEAVTFDQYENVIVTGSSCLEGGVRDYLTVKYDSGGDELWRARYDGPTGLSDHATDVAVDGTGNVYVTGNTETQPGGGWSSWATVKYDFYGIQQWAAFHDGPGGIAYAVRAACDKAGSVVVAGYSRPVGPWFDYSTVGYSDSGEPIWEASYDGSGHSEDRVAALSGDLAGGVIVAGTSDAPDSLGDSATICYDVSGAERWMIRSNLRPYAALTDAWGNCYLTGSRGGHCSTTKYDEAGLECWSSTYVDPNGQFSSGKAIAVDAMGNVFVGGDCQFDCLVVSYDAFGSQRWAHLWDGPAHGYDRLAAVAVDHSGNMFMAGTSDGTTRWDDFVTVKFSPSGETVWTARYHGPSTACDDGAVDIAVDAAGCAYVLGTSYGVETLTDYVTIKYDSTGGEEWISRFDGPRHVVDEATAIAIDGCGNVLVTGCSTSSDWGKEYATVKYDPSGFMLWVARYGEPESDWSRPVDIVSDEEGNVYVTGLSEDDFHSTDFATVKYGPNGAVQWAARYNGPGYYDDEAVGLIVDELGAVYVAGSSAGPNGAEWPIDEAWSVYTTIKYVQPGLSSPHEPGTAPLAFSLDSCSPNPLKDAATVRFALPSATDLSIRIVDLGGRQVKTLVNGLREPGRGSVTWDGSDEQGHRVASGVYLCLMEADGFRQTRKLVVIR